MPFDVHPACPKLPNMSDEAVIHDDLQGSHVFSVANVVPRFCGETTWLMEMRELQRAMEQALCAPLSGTLVVVLEDAQP